MAQLKVKTLRKNAVEMRKSIEAYYRTKYFSLYMNAYEFTGLDYLKSRFLLTQLWEVGTACFLNAISKEDLGTVTTGEGEEIENELVICPYAPETRNIYNAPISIVPVNLRGVAFIPRNPQKVNEDCVIMFGHSSHMPIRYIVDSYIEKIVEIEVAIRMNVETHKLPRLIACKYEDKEHFKELFRDIENGQFNIFVEADDPSKVNAILNGGEYIIDKLYAYKLNLEKELMTMLGIDNVGMVKKERENLDETNANNEEIDQGGDCFIDEMEIGCEQIQKVLGHDISVREKNPRVEMSGQYNADDPSNKEEKGGNEE